MQRTMQGFALHPPRLDRERVTSAVAVAVVHVALGWALLTGLGVSIPEKTQEVLETFNVLSPPPPRPEPPQQPPKPLKERAPQKEGAAAPPNIKSRATEVVAPKTEVPIPPPVIVAEKPGPALDPTQGNAPIFGPGTGAGGIGDGTGSGRYGDGPGGGGGGGTPLRLISGRIKNSDYPREAFATRAQGSVGLSFVVGTNGRVTSCTVTRSSGNRALDNTTCRLISERFRYRPATDRFGRPYPQTVTGEHVWELSERFVSRDEYDRDDDGSDPDDR